MKQNRERIIGRIIEAAEGAADPVEVANTLYRSSQQLTPQEQKTLLDAAAGHLGKAELHLEQYEDEAERTRRQQQIDRLASQVQDSAAAVAIALFRGAPSEEKEGRLQEAEKAIEGVGDGKRRALLFAQLAGNIPLEEAWDKRR